VTRIRAWVGPVIVRAAFVIGLLAAGALRANRADAASPARATKEGNALYREGKFPEARDRYFGAQSDRPDAPELEFNIGDTFFREGQNSKAIESFGKVAAKKTLGSKIRSFASYNLGNACLAAKQFDPAIEAYRAALRLDPTDLDAKHNLELAMKKKAQAEQQKKEQDQQKKDSKDDKNENQKKDEKQKDGEKKDDQSGKQDQNQDEKQDEKSEQPEQKPQAGDDSSSASAPDSAAADSSDSQQAVDGKTIPRSDAIRILEALEAQEMAQAREKERQTLLKALLSEGKDW